MFFLFYLDKCEKGGGKCIFWRYVWFLKNYGNKIFFYITLKSFNFGHVFLNLCFKNCFLFYNLKTSFRKHDKIDLYFSYVF